LSESSAMGEGRDRLPMQEVRALDRVSPEVD
jgi:hypothetical protein